MAMNILAYTFAVIALAAGIKCFVDETWGEKMHHESEEDKASSIQNVSGDKKAA